MSKKKSVIGRPKLEENLVKDQTITLRVNDDQCGYFENARRSVEVKSGIPVTKTWVIMKLCELGMPLFEREFNLKKKKSVA